VDTAYQELIANWDDPAIHLAYQGLILMYDGLEDAIPKVIPPFLTGCIRRTYAAIFSFWAGVMPPMPMLGRSLL
jgi:hypothetical protein